ncbi:MAG TPA: DUF3558 domain-containing protein [Mycobacterium sp.]|uniref:DUF3558 domain-containing protein n=1 Tax=Mycolicibacterium sp. TaxID=2320850 RepID=UPI0025F976E0|nr:DUF3558 domain-containing protein [Mycolicibacterium sp.]HPX36060.1 DUF3558 domain-containing protein [Mycobacterium sp.]HQC75863.1 DUF3558 domain-containing protein [Mycobacterium sp.]
MRTRLIAGGLAVVSSLAVLTGCSKAVTGTAMKAGSGSSNNNSAQKYPNLLKECDVLTTDVLAKAVGADPLDIQSTFVGAVCRWQAANPAGLIDITRFWYEQGSLDNERKVAEFLQYKTESRAINGVASIVMHGNDPNGGCGVASDAQGVVGWWINPQAPGEDACGIAIKLMEMTLATNS